MEPKSSDPVEPGRRKTSAVWRNYRVFWILFILVALGNVVSFSYRREIGTLMETVRPWLAAYFATEERPAGPEMPSRPRYEAKPLDPLTVATPPFGEFSPVLRFEPPYLVTSSERLSVQGRELHLGYLVGLGATDLCLNEAGGKFPCGLMGRASMQNHIAAHSMTCTPLFYGEGDIRFDCRLADGTTLAEYQILAGFVRPDALGYLHLLEASELARATKVGAWNGNWTVETLAELKEREIAAEKQRIEALGDAARPPEGDPAR